jgi:hypothetical protein
MSSASYRYNPSCSHHGAKSDRVSRCFYSTATYARVCTTRLHNNSTRMQAILVHLHLKYWNSPRHPIAIPELQHILHTPYRLCNGPAGSMRGSRRRRPIRRFETAGYRIYIRISYRTVCLQSIHPTEKDDVGTDTCERELRLHHPFLTPLSSIAVTACGRNRRIESLGTTFAPISLVAGNHSQNMGIRFMLVQ